MKMSFRWSSSFCFLVATLPCLKVGAIVLPMIIVSLVATSRTLVLLATSHIYCPGQVGII